MYRGRFRHEPAVNTALTRLAHTVFGLPTWGPKELFYADLFASQKTPCRSQLGLPGVRDQHSGCVAEHLVQNDLFDFLLLSLPDNDTHSHKYGPFAQVDSIAAADRQIARMMEPAGGPDKFLEDHAVIVCSDHSQSKVEGEIDLFKRVRRLRPARGAALARGRRDRGLPELAGGAGLRARSRQAADADPARRADAARARGRRPRDADGRSPGRRGDRARRALARRQGGPLRPARRPDGCPRRALERRGRPRPARAEDRGRPDPLADLPGRDEPRLERAALPVGGRGAGRAPGPATSSSTGAARTTSAAARTARCTPTTPSGRCCGPGPGRRSPRASSGRCATSRRWCSSTSAYDELVGQLDAVAGAGEQEPAARSPFARWSWRIVVRPAAAASGMSSKPTTESSGATSRMPSASGVAHREHGGHVSEQVRRRAAAARPGPVAAS